MRVLKLTKKPKKQEFTLVAKITGLGMVILGLLGFVIIALKHVFPGVF